MSRWLVTGAGGMLGHDLCRVLGSDPAVKLTAHTHRSLDITRPAEISAAIDVHDIVINTAAWTDVDGAEADEQQATLVNGTALSTLADTCAERGIRLIQLSTDYVLPGRSSSPYQEDSSTAPINAYGRSKLVGESAVLSALPELGYVVRTAWLYGEHGRNFVDTILRRAEDHATLQVVEDQRGQPTWTLALARQLVSLGHAALAGQAPPGIYHGTAGGSATWYDLACAAFSEAGLDRARISPVTSAAFPRPAQRPEYSVLSHDRWAAAGIAAQPDWRVQLSQAFAAGVFASSRG